MIDDTISGIAELNARNRERRKRLDATKIFCAGMILGASIATAVFLLYHCIK
jgi:hypothetical protein